METLLAELQIIKAPKRYYSCDYMYKIRSNVLQSPTYEDKKRRFVKILQSVNPYIKIQYTKNNVIQLLMNDINLIKVNIYYKYETKKYWHHVKYEYDNSHKCEYFIKLDIIRQSIHRICILENELDYQFLKRRYHDRYIYDGGYVEKLLKLYYTNDEFIENVPDDLKKLMSRDLINLIYSYTTSSFIFG